jgi:hypothetical protein
VVVETTICSGSSASCWITPYRRARPGAVGCATWAFVRISPSGETTLPDPRYQELDGRDRRTAA